MMKQSIFAILLMMTGCATVEQKAYHPDSGKEKTAFAQAVKHVSPADVQKNFLALQNTEVAWAGLIKDVQFKETERTVLVAFQIEHRNFDWMDYGGKKPYRLSADGDGVFFAGSTIQKPTQIGKLKHLAKPGYMILVYGNPYQMREGAVQLSTSALRPIPSTKYEVVSSTTEKKDPVVEDGVLEQN